MPLLTNQEIKALIALRTDTINDMELELTELKDTVSMLRFELAAREAFK
jgi:ribosomal protein L29